MEHRGIRGLRSASTRRRPARLLPANEPWNLVASGSLGEDVTVEFYAGLKKLDVLKTYDENPFLVQLEGLPPGLHIIHAVTNSPDGTEISSPSTVMFQQRET